ncbi:discoidin domain-containing protein [Pseudophaeobacter leonis]|uniref:discoidin domain-containing protein n=1 Tax=Pseudophaeobacter leonis TaxID=1144477 RepID=UPI0009F5F91D|nr:discoidin domain-containing protein [Pseudophaeobacter leonis]
MNRRRAMMRRAAAASYPHWRMNVSGVTSGSSIALAELELRSSYGGAQAAIGGTATTSNAAYGAAANAFDGHAATFWATNGVPEWLAYELPSPLSVMEIQLRSRSGVTSQTPHVFTIEGSADGVAWDVVSTHSIAEMAAETTLVLTVQ